MALGFEEISKKLQQLGIDAANSVQKMGEAYQASSKLSDAKKALNKLYAQLGKAMAEQMETAPEGMEDLFQAIASAKIDVEACEKQIQAIKGVVFCPSCGKEGSRNENFCSACGTKLPDPPQPEEEPVEEDVFDEMDDLFEEEETSEESAPVEEPVTEADAEKAEDPKED